MVFSGIPKLTNTSLSKNLSGFGRRVAELREKTGLDRREFAKLCGISYKHYFNIENGASLPAFRGYIAICLAAGVKEIPLVGKD